MLPGMRATIARMARRLPDKRHATNPIQAEPDRPLALLPSRNRPALGASSNKGDRDSGA